MQIKYTNFSRSVSSLNNKLHMALGEYHTCQNYMIRVSEGNAMREYLLKENVKALGHYPTPSRIIGGRCACRRRPPPQAGHGTLAR